MFFVFLTWHRIEKISYDCETAWSRYAIDNFRLANHSAQKFLLNYLKMSDRGTVMVTAQCVRRVCSSQSYEIFSTEKRLLKSGCYLLAHGMFWQGLTCSGSPWSVQSRPPCIGSGLVHERNRV